MIGSVFMDGKIKRDAIFFHDTGNGRSNVPDEGFLAYFSFTDK